MWGDLPSENGNTQMWDTNTERVFPTDMGKGGSNDPHKWERPFLVKGETLKNSNFLVFPQPKKIEPFKGNLRKSHCLEQAPLLECKNRCG